MAFAVVSFTALLCCFACVGVFGNKCAEDITKTCMQSLMNITTHRKPVLARYKEELEVICKRLTPDLQCVNNFITACFSNEQKNAVGGIINKSMELFRDLCEDGPYKSEYLQHADCYHRLYDENYCNDSFQQFINVSTLPSDRSNSQQAQLKKYCCAYTDFLQCSISKTLDICGEETANFMESHLRKIGDPLIMGQCNMNSYTLAECSSALCWTKTSCTLLLMMTLLSLLAGQINRHKCSP